MGDSADRRGGSGFLSCRIGNSNLDCLIFQGGIKKALYGSRGLPFPSNQPILGPLALAMVFSCCDH